MARAYGLITYCSICGKSSERCSCPTSKTISKPTVDKMVKAPPQDSIEEPEAPIDTDTKIEAPEDLKEAAGNELEAPETSNSTKKPRSRSKRK